ncbi:MAG: ABC transporter permease [Chloroflexota bacterium]
MTRFIATRILQSLLILFAVSVVIFLLARLSGDPVHLLLPLEATDEMYEETRRELGLDQPPIIQYWAFISNAVRGDFGVSISRQREPVMGMILERLPNSLILAGAAVGWSLAIGIPLGVFAAVHRRRLPDTIARIIALLGQSLPSFFVGIVFISIFAVNFRLFPVMGGGSIRHFVLPSLTIGWFVTAGVVRLLRSSMLDVLDAEYIKLARTKGVSETMVVWKHALRNAILPVATFAGFTLGILIAAAIVVETVFVFPGIGQLAYHAVLTRDYPLLQALVLVWTTLVVMINLAVDISYAYLDPRIRY